MLINLNKMNLKKLEEINLEVKRFQKVIDEAIVLAKTVKGWKSSYDGSMVGVNNISGTRMSGSVKRNALELKYFLTKKL